MSWVGGGPVRLKPGEWTDDTAMALCLADSLIASDGVLDPRDLATRFVRWWDKGENSVNGYCFDIGIATSQALHGFKTTGQPTGSTDPRSAGNGGIMRLAPAVIAARGDRGRRAQYAGKPKCEHRGQRPPRTVVGPARPHQTS